MAVYNDTVQSAAYGEAVVFPFKLTEFIVAKVQASATVFKYDFVEAAAFFEEIITTRSDLKRFFEESAGANAVTAQQVSASQALLQIDKAQGDTTFLRSARGQQSLMQANASGSAAVPQQTARLNNTVVQTHSIAAPVVQGKTRARNTVEALSGGIGVPANLISEWVNSTAKVVFQRRHTRDQITQDATASFVELSARLRQQLRDSLVDAASATSEVAAAQVQASELLVEVAEVIDELLEVLPRELWVFNAQTLAFSRYTDTLATGVASVDGEPAFTSNSGVQRFVENQYADTEVEWGLSNFDSLALKRLVSAYVASAGDANITLSARHSLRGKVQEHRYNVPAAPSLAPVTRRCLLARGYLGQYWGVRLQTRGGYATLDNVVITPLIDTRRV